MSADLQLTSQVLDDLISGLSGFSGRLAAACAGMLRQVGAAFDRLESELASDLTRSK